MSSLKHAPILILRAHGMTNAARKTATNVPGPSTFRWSHSATEPSGRVRVSGPTTRITPEPTTRTVPPKKDASTATEDLPQRIPPNHPRYRSQILDDSAVFS